MSGEPSRELPNLEDLQARIEAQEAEITRLKERQRLLQDNLGAKNRQVAELRKNVELRRRPGSALSGERAPLFFMVGRGRSGTTWLMRLLDAHPEIACKGEGNFFDRNFRQEEFKELHPRLKPSSLYNALADSEYLKLWIERSVWTAQDRLSPEDHVDNLTRLAVEYFMNRRLSRLRRRSPGKRIVGDKTPFMSGKVLHEMDVSRLGGPGPETGAPPYSGAGVVEEISRISPDAKVIHVIRDGRDVAVSLMHFMWSRSRDESWIYELEPEEIRKRRAYREDPASLAGESIFTRERLTAIARGWASEVAEAVERGPGLLGDRYFEVRYEDLLASPEQEAERLLRFLGADAEPGTIRECIEATGFERSSKRRQGEEDSSSVSHRKGVAGDWKNVFTGEDERIFEEHAGDLLARLGYKRDPE
ncbi:MAG: sulfotransferase [Rubrobacter sp.]|nr:sulfotransferase [Rubrobacter sp.]